MRAPAVSVVLPTYNRARSLRAAVDSVLRQTFADLELIVVDDRSTDDTAAVLAGMADPRLRVIVHDANRGGAAARNTGVAAARAPLVAFQDSDDEWLPAKLEKQVARLEGDGHGGGGPVGVYCGMIVVNSPLEAGARANGAPRVRYVPQNRALPVEGDILTSLLSHSLISTQTFVARREALARAGGFDERLRALQDWDCVLRVARLGPIALVDEPLVIQRFSEDSLSRSSENRLASRIAIFEKNQDVLAARPAQYATQCYAIAGALAEFGRHAEAVGWLRKARSRAPGRLRIHLNLARNAALALLAPARR